MARIFICGVPGAGKTSLARMLTPPGGHVVHTDDYLHLPHDTIPAALAQALQEHTVCEGVQVARLLRRYPHVADGATVYYLRRRHPGAGAWSRGQAALAKGLRKIWSEAKRELRTVHAVVVDGV